MLTLFGLILGRAGFRVETALDGVPGLKLLNSQEFDLLLVDDMLPIMPGYELVRRVRADPRWDALPVLTCDARAKAGVDGYFTKPFLPGILVVAASDLALHGRKTLPDPAA